MKSSIGPQKGRTLCELFQSTIRRIPNAIALRSYGNDLRLSFEAYDIRVRKVAAGLAKLGIGSGDAVALMMTNRPEFNICDSAALHLGAISFSVYNTSSPEQINYVLMNAAARIVICERQFLKQLEQSLASTAIERIICIDGNPNGTTSLESLEAAGELSFDFEKSWRSVTPEHVATIIYTSGTTGPPKGVELSHHNLAAQIRSVGSVLSMSPDDVTISYLPAAHIAERCYGHYHQMAHGFEVVCLADARAIEAALLAVRPTIWVGTPRFWEKIKAVVDQRFASEPRTEESDELTAAMEVATALTRARQRSLRGEADGLNRSLVDAGSRAQAALTPMRESLGLNRARWIVVSGAPSRPEILEFFISLGMPLTEAWGASELSCVATLTPPEEMRIGSVGKPIPGVELSIAADREILCRGEGVMKAYRSDRERTNETIDSEGWFHTGDLGAIDDRGYLALTGRKKEIIINAAGKNMSPANIEAKVLAACPLILHAVCIGDRRPYNVALFVMQPGQAKVEAAHAVAQAVEQANAQLSRAEQIKRFRIIDAHWESGSDEITLTGKLKRSVIAEKYAGVIDDLYREGAGFRANPEART